MVELINYLNRKCILTLLMTFLEGLTSHDKLRIKRPFLDLSTSGRIWPTKNTIGNGNKAKELKQTYHIHE